MMRRTDPLVTAMPGITRRQLFAAAGVAGVGALAMRSPTAMAAPPLLTAQSRFPKPTKGQTYFTRGRDLVQSRNPAQLSTWLETEHLKYQLGGWFFFGRLQGDAGEQDFGSFVLALQRLPVQGFDVYGGGVGFCGKAEDGYDYVPIVFPKDYSDLRVVVQSDPWLTQVLSPAQTAPLVSMKTLSGRMGQVGTKYLLEADLPPDMNPGGTGRMVVKVRVRDPFGVIGQGYGSTAFCPQFLTSPQRNRVVNGFGGSVRQYLKRTDDPMICQGSWYYQLPFLVVERFRIQVGDRVRSEGKDGLLWMDQLVQTYDAQAAAAVLDSKYEFFAIQFPKQKSAMMVMHVDGQDGDFPVATLFDADSARAANNAMRPRHSWPITGISIEPDSGSAWRSPASGNTYFLRHRIRLDSPKMSADLTVKMSKRNQEFQEQAGGLWDYEGIGDVAGSLNGRHVRGQAFVEAVPTTVGPTG